ncbi:hypothetical protein LCM08_20645 [Salipiger pacificus]|nr:hypothetical protein [Alloyangia pacifica]
MPQVKFDSTVSAGNLLSILSMVVGLTAGYVTLRNSQEAQALAIERLENEGRAREVRLRSAEMTQAGQASDLRAISATLQKIDGKIDRLTLDR